MCCHLGHAARLGLIRRASHVPIARRHEIVSVVVISPPVPASRGSRVDVGSIRLVPVFLVSRQPQRGGLGASSTATRGVPPLAVPSGQVLRQGPRSP
jgi:hypothetical protein